MHFVIHAVDKTDALPTRAKFYRAHRIHLDQAVDQFTLLRPGFTLTADNVKKGFFSVPATGGAATGTVAFQSGYGKTVGMPYDEYSLLGTDRAFAYWDADTTGPSQAVNIVGKGVMIYMDGGKRYNYKGFPKAEPKYFDPKGAVAAVPVDAQFTGGVAPEASPCTNCPSNGGTG